MLKANISNIYLLPSSYSISYWIRSKGSSGCLLNKSFNETEIISISINDLKVIINVQVNFQQHNFESSSRIELNKWTHLFVNVIFAEFTSIELVLDAKLDINEVVTKYPFQDFFSEFLFVGGSPKESFYFEGFIFIFEIYSMVVSLESLVTESAECYLCPTGRNCIPDCDLGEFYDETIMKCIKCPDSCYGICKNSSTCQLCADSNCKFCSSFKINSCFFCEQGYHSINQTCIKCSESQYYDTITEKCLECQDLCLACTSSTKCTACIDHSELIKGTCKCSKGYKHEKFCKRVYFSATLEIRKENKVGLAFTENLQYSLKKEDLLVQVNENFCDFDLIEYSKFQYSLKIDENKIVKDSVLILNFVNELLSETNSLLRSEELKGVFYYDSELKRLSEEARAAKADSRFKSVAGVSAVAGLSLIMMDPSSFFDFLNTAEMLYSAYFFNLDLHPRLSGYLIGMRIQEILPNSFTYFISPNSGVSMPKKLKKFGYQSNLMILNLGVQLQTLSATVFAVTMILPLYCSKRLKSKLERIKKIFKFGFFLRFWLQTSLEIMISCTFGVIYCDFDGAIQKFDYILSFILLFTQVCFFVLILYLINKRSGLSNEEEIKKFIDKFGTFFEEFKKDGVHNWLFYLIYFTRRIVLAILFHTVSIGILQLTVCVSICLCVSFK